MNSARLKRLDEVWRQLKPEPMRVVCGLPDGEAATMTVDEMLECEGGFIRVAHGSGFNGEDMNKILERIEKAAYETVEGGAD